MAVLITTSRLTIRPLLDSDSPAMLAVYADAEVMRYIPGGARDETGSAERLRDLIEHQAEHGVSKWAVVLTATGQVIGDCGLQYLDGTSDLEIGFHLARQYWGQGFATEAACACLRWAQTERTERIVAMVDPDHSASRRILERIGLRHDGEAQHFGRTWEL